MNSETKVFKAIKSATSNGSLKTFVVLLVGAAMAWAVMRTQVSGLISTNSENRKEHKEYREDIKDIVERLSRIEGLLEVVIPKK